MSPSRYLIPILLAIAAIMFARAPFLIGAAPLESTMGLVQKIFYFHVPSALTTLLSAVVCGIASLVYIVRRRPTADRVALAAAELAVVFGIIMLITGPLWARKAWGVWWTWDPRLTSVMLEAMIFLAYLVLRAFGGTGEVEKRFAAGLAIVGLLDIPLIRYSVQRWRGTHPVVVTGKGGGIAPDMKPALYVSSLLFVVLAIVFIWTRVRSERLRQRVEALELEAAERGLLEET
jgi:heme exporter protein C